MRSPPIGAAGRADAGAVTALRAADEAMSPDSGAAIDACIFDEMPSAARLPGLVRALSQLDRHWRCR
jgi:hypothetical protein